VHKQHSYSAREKRAAKAAQALLHAGCLWGGGSRPYGWSLIVIPSEGVSAAFSGAARRGIPVAIIPDSTNLIEAIFQIIVNGLSVIYVK